MITVKLLRSADQYRSFCVSGHAGYAASGEDIVCAGVTSAVQLTVNGICEVLGVKAQLTVRENQVSLTLPADAVPTASLFLEALALHLTLLSEDYPDCISLEIESPCHAATHLDD